MPLLTKTGRNTYQCILYKVGAGSAGCVLANRLSEDPGTSVLIVEAGGSEDDNPMMSVPFAAPTLQTSEQDWAFRTVPQKKACLGLKDKVRYKEGVFRTERQGEI